MQSLVVQFFDSHLLPAVQQDFSLSFDFFGFPSNANAETDASVMAKMDAVTINFFMIEMVFILFVLIDVTNV